MRKSPNVGVVLACLGQVVSSMRAGTMRRIATTPTGGRLCFTLLSFHPAALRGGKEFFVRIKSHSYGADTCVGCFALCK